MQTTYKLKCHGGFRDGNVFPRYIKPNEVLEVDETTFRRLTQSDPAAFEVLEARKQVPPPTKAKPKTKKATVKERADDGEAEG